jgi:glycosyltransferase A (GT-A) superfamily protein (DUF2064 family)
VIAKARAYYPEPSPQISKVSLVSTYTACSPRPGILGPEVSGGYYFVGLKEGSPSHMQETPRDTGWDLWKTLNILKNQSLSYITLNALSDAGTLQAMSGSGVRNHSNIWE